MFEVFWGTGKNVDKSGAKEMEFGWNEKLGDRGIIL